MDAENIHPAFLFLSDQVYIMLSRIHDRIDLDLLFLLINLVENQMTLYGQHKVTLLLQRTVTGITADIRLRR